MIEVISCCAWSLNIGNKSVYIMVILW